MPFSQFKKKESMLDGFNYHAFLLRCWQEAVPGAGQDSTWRFSLIHFDGLQTKKGFACLDDLVDYLQAELAKRDALITRE